MHARHDPTTGYERDFVSRHLDFYRAEYHLRLTTGDLVRIDVPEDAGWAVHRDWLLIRPRSSWTVGEVTYPAGALLAIENGDAVGLETLRACVVGLGGHLDIVVRIGNIQLNVA